MIALTLTQPWATLVGIEAKKIETRSWKPPRSLIGQKIAIHAGKGLADMSTRQFCELCITEPFKSALVTAWKNGLIPSLGAHLFPGDLPRGAVIAIARLAGAWSTNMYELVDRVPDKERAFGNYGPNRWMWYLDDVQLLPEPIPAKGALGMWKWDAEVGA